MQVLRGRVITPEQIITDGVLAAESGVLTYVGEWEHAPATVRSSGVPADPQHYLLPGLVDVHNHGGGGASFPDSENLVDLEVAIEEHARFGTTSMLASLVTASAQTLKARVAM